MTWPAYAEKRLVFVDALIRGSIRMLENYQRYDVVWHAAIVFRHEQGVNGLIQYFHSVDERLDMGARDCPHCYSFVRS